MRVLSAILSVISWILILAGYCWTVFTLFPQDGALMGILGLLPMISIYAAIRHCIDRKGPSWTLLGGICCFMVAAILEPKHS
jgi:hypothetical protein